MYEHVYSSSDILFNYFPPNIKIIKVQIIYNGLKITGNTW